MQSTISPIENNSHAASESSSGLRTLAIDIGGTGLKASVLDENGAMLVDRVRVATPHPCPPESLLDALTSLIAPLPNWDRVSVGFPGVVRKGRTLTAHNLGQEAWEGFDLRAALARRLGKPVQVKNDADLQGLGAISGSGVEVVITLGTGFGSALFDDGWIAPHLEFAHHPFRKGETYEEQLGIEALKRAGRKRWNRRVKKAIATLRALTFFDRLYIGGGNAAKIDFALDAGVEIISNDLGMRGGIWLWRKRIPADNENNGATTLAASNPAPSGQPTPPPASDP
jgi:polyphosphate glucokinase